MVIFRNLLAGSSQSEIMTTALDLTKTAASFASDTHAVEPLLYQLRSISDGLRSTSLLTSEEENSIFDIYFKLEHYLTTADPIRHFNKEELRNKASISLRSRLEAYENKVMASKQPA